MHDPEEDQAINLYGPMRDAFGSYFALQCSLQGSTIKCGLIMWASRSELQCQSPENLGISGIPSRKIFRFLHKSFVASTLSEDKLGWFTQLFRGDQSAKISDCIQRRPEESFTRGSNHPGGIPRMIGLGGPNIRGSKYPVTLVYCP